MGFVVMVFQPSTLRMLVWPEASNAQNNIAAVSADGSTVCVLILRLNSSCSRSIALVVRALRHWEEIEKHRRAFIRKWRLKHEAVANSLEEAGDRLFTFTRLPPDQWRSVRTTNAIERLHEEFKRRIKTQTVLPSADTAAMLFWALLASGQINMRKVVGWQGLATKPIDQPIDLAA